VCLCVGCGWRGLPLGTSASRDSAPVTSSALPLTPPARPLSHPPYRMAIPHFTLLLGQTGFAPVVQALLGDPRVNPEETDDVSWDRAMRRRPSLSPHPPPPLSALQDGSTPMDHAREMGHADVASPPEGGPQCRRRTLGAGRVVITTGVLFVLHGDFRVFGGLGAPVLRTRTHRNRPQRPQYRGEFPLVSLGAPCRCGAPTSLELRRIPPSSASVAPLEP